ncbi:restriction endonuclease subunit S [Rhodomicrobium sp. Az07]|uniref:restriction endonuclease subunit S n=1 Tax=Rhodomicrobium sp. Az07 TaxID=2839034 RepID=UPI001BEC9BBB|nr:restriction endonuclease subunit S [Rhodomicrobium sp. Az07]MBT3071430.1 restriction endonuclease subunit S [Rhodomicrobium sp. Az07]
MEGRHVITIGSLCEQGLVELQTGPFGSQLHAHDYTDLGIPVVPTEAIRNRRIDLSSLPKITPHKAGELSRHRLMRGDILFARRGVQATGHIGYVRDAEDGFVCGTGAIRLRVNENSRILDGEYLSHVLANPQSIQWLKFHAIGATMPNLNEGIIRSFSFSLPPYAEQRIVASFLSALDDKIELNRRMNETLEAMARAIFKDWFVDFGPTRAKMEGRAPYLAPDLWALFPDKLVDDGKPEGWAVDRLLNQARLVSGGTPKTDESAYWNGSIQWASAKDVSQCANTYLIQTERSITEAGLENSATRIIPRFATVMVARGATTGRYCMFGGDMAMNQTCYALASGRPFFIYCAFSFLVDELVFNAHGSVFDTITTRTIEAATLTVPSSEMLNKFEKVVEPLFMRILLNQNENCSLTQTRDLLLPKLMSGEIHLREAEKLVEAAA